MQMAKLDTLIGLDDGVSLSSCQIRITKPKRKKIAHRVTGHNLEPFGACVMEYCLRIGDAFPNLVSTSHAYVMQYGCDAGGGLPGAADAGSTARRRLGIPGLTPFTTGSLERVPAPGAGGRMHADPKRFRWQLQPSVSNQPCYDST